MPTLSPLTAMLTPGGRFGAVAHSGAGVNPVLSPATRPPPKSATSVKVWFRPPSFVTFTVSLGSILRYEGSFRHAGCPMVAEARGDVSRALNSSSLTSPSSSAQPPVGAQPESVGSQSSRTATFSRAVAMTAPIVHAPTNNAKTMPHLRNLLIFYLPD